MKTGILVGSLLVGSQLAMVSLAAQAERIIPVVVNSATRSEQAEVNTPNHITIISRDDIQASGAATVAEVLKGRGSIHLSDTFGDGSRTNISMRGFGDTANANTLVLVDGRRLNNMDIASPDLNSVSLKDVERIEITQGSATVLYGDQAVGGVINIITRSTDKSYGGIEIGAGSYGANRLQAQFSQALGKQATLRVSGEKRHGQGYRDHNELNYENLFGLFEYRHNQGKWFVEMQSTDENLHTPGALYLAEAKTDRRQARTEYQNDYIDTQTGVFRIGLQHVLTPEWKFEGEWTYRESDGEFLQSSRNAPETIPATQRRRVNSFNPRLIGNHSLNGRTILTTLGYDYDESRYRLSSRFGPQRSDQTVSGWYGQSVIPLSDKTRLTAGVRHSRVENTLQDGFTYPAGQDVNDDLTAYELGVEYRPAAHWRLYARRADNFRFAKVDEYLSPIWGAATIIDNQTGRSLEAGAEYQYGDWQGSLLVYDMRLDDEIIFDSTNFANINLDRTRRQGLTLNLAYQINLSTRLELDVDTIDADILTGAFAGNNIPMVANYTARLGVHHKFNDQWRLYGELYAVGNRPYSGDFDNVLDDLNGYRVVNMSLNYERKSWQFDLRVNNVFNKEYADFGARHDVWGAGSFESIQPSPERNFSASVAYQFY